MVTIGTLNGGNITVTLGGGGSSGHSETRVKYTEASGITPREQTFNIEGELADSSIDNISDVEEVDIGNTVTSISNEAFFECSGLTNVMIGNGVTSIGDEAFRECSGLTIVTIGNSVEYIGTDAFFGCSSVTDVYCYPNPANLTWDEDSCDDFKSGGSTICHVKSEYLSAYQSKFNGEVNVTFVGDLT